MSTILPVTYLGPIQYWAHLVNSPESIIELCCNFERQTYRNRVNILAANGVLPLSIPVEKPLKGVTKTKDALISYDTPWQANHWRSIVSAYMNTPYFEFYADDYEKIYGKNYRFLIDMHAELYSIIADNLGVEPSFVYSDSYIKAGDDDLDLRDVIHPKRDWREDSQFFPAPYRQIFSDKYGFTPNLSIIDLIFNKGPESILYLRDCMEG